MRSSLGHRTILGHPGVASEAGVQVAAKPIAERIVRVQIDQRDVLAGGIGRRHDRRQLEFKAIMPLLLYPATGKGDDVAQ